VCSIVRVINKHDKTDFISDAFPIAGELNGAGGGYSDVKWTRLKTSKLDTDAGKEGVRLEINGGFRTVDDVNKKQKAFVEFLCDTSLEGDERLWIPKEEYEDENIKRGEEIAGGGPSLQFVNYTLGKDEDVLKLLWKTRYACEKPKEEDNEKRKSHWGFFTWFIIMYVFTHHDIQPCGDVILTFLQCVLIYCYIPHIRLLAELQPIRSAWMGSSSSRGHNPRCAILA
jgi:autophagy-related protein 27